MKSIVLSFLVAVLALPFGSAATELPSLPKAMAKAGCGSPSAVSASGVEYCTQVARAYCRDVGDPHCDKYDVVRKPISSCKMIGGSSPAGPGAELLAGLSKSCNTLSQQQDLCCNTSSADACLKEVAEASGTATVTDPAGKTTPDPENTLFICKKLKEGTAMAAYANNSIAGTCVARNYYWNVECTRIKAEAPYLCGNNAGKIIPCTEPHHIKFQSDIAALDCGLKDPAAIKEQAKAMASDSKIAALCEDSSAADPDGDGGGGDVAGGDTEDDDGYEEASVDDKEKKKGGGGGDLLSALGPMFESLMKQDEEEEEEKEDIDCAINPANCPAGEPAAGATAMNRGTMNSGSLGTDPDFNPDDISGASIAPDLAPVEANSSGAGGTIPNGGGGMPGGLGGGGGGGMPGGGGYKGASVDPKNIGGGFNAYGGGNFGSMNAGMKLEPGSTGGYRAPSGGGGDDNFDLRPFLPGQSKDPLRGLAGNNPRIAEIQGKGVDIWLRISDRIKNHCNQGLLRDCTP